MWMPRAVTLMETLLICVHMMSMYGHDFGRFHSGIERKGVSGSRSLSSSLKHPCGRHFLHLMSILFCQQRGALFQTDQQWGWMGKFSVCVREREYIDLYSNLTTRYRKGLQHITPKLVTMTIPILSNCIIKNYNDRGGAITHQWVSQTPEAV